MPYTNALQEPNIWRNIQAGHYTHILMSPEQALSPNVKAIMRAPEFQRELGLFSIDHTPVHTVSKHV
jgi:hypothetical protein